MPLISMLPSLISGGASLLGGIFGSDASKKASQAQVDALNKGISTIQQGAKTATSDVNNLYSLGENFSLENYLKSQGYSQPMLQTGNNALNMLGGFASQGAQPGGSQSNIAPSNPFTQWSESFKAPTVADLNDPNNPNFAGYQFAKQQGTDAIQNSAAAKGTLLNSGTLKDLSGYTTGLADQYAQQQYGNALNSYNTNYGAFQNNQNNTFNRLYGLAGFAPQGANMLQNLGLQTGSQLGSLYGNQANQLGNISMSSSQDISNLLSNIGSAKGAGIAGSANSWLNAIPGIGNSLLGLLGKKPGNISNPNDGSSQGSNYSSWLSALGAPSGWAPGMEG